MNGDDERDHAEEAANRRAIIADRYEDTADLAAEDRLCPDCAVKVGEFHKDGCDVARCLYTGRQRLSCETQSCGSDVWTGQWPGEHEAQLYGVTLNDLHRPNGRFRWAREIRAWVPK